MPALSVIVPVHNEEGILLMQLQKMQTELARVLPGMEYELLVIENGSNDRTNEIASECANHSTQIQVHSLPDASYGTALKHGILQAQGTYCVLFNIDYWDMNFTKLALVLCDNENHAIIVGSKVMQGARDDRPMLRKMVTRSFNAFLRFLFQFKGTDTHGMKVLRRSDVVPIVRECITSREVFDTELLLRSQRRGLSIVEVPVACTEMRPRAIVNVLRSIPRTLRDVSVLYRYLPK